MKRSFIDRIFPHSSAPLLPQHEQTEPFIQRSPQRSRSPPFISMNEASPIKVPNFTVQSLPVSTSSDVSSSSKIKDNNSLRSAPLSTSVLHHDDPFLPIDRASRALEASIQLLLDAQSRALNGRAHGIDQDDIASAGSLTPTQSATTPRSASGLRAVPIRQPVRKPITLRGARKGLLRKMHEFAELREQELQILEKQSQARMQALTSIQELETKREACIAEIDQIRQADASTTATKLRSEAKNVKVEIQELEHKLLELRVRHRHLINQAEQVESTLESKSSSFKGTLAMIDKESREFLRRPPVSHALAGGPSDGQPGMYALNPERRTLVMAKEQWSSEQELLANRLREVESEVNALHEGEHIWSETIQRITTFEQLLRQQTVDLANRSQNDSCNSMDTILERLKSVIQHLESNISTAEDRGWSLLICAIGAELEAFHQARQLLEHTQQIASGTNKTGSSDVDSYQSQFVGTIPSPARSTGSNQSLKDTLVEFSRQPDATLNNMSHGSNKYESEDDEPPADFLLSR